MSHRSSEQLRWRSTTRGVTISAVPSAAWAVLTDPLWLAEWFQGVRSIDGDFHLHGRLRVVGDEGALFVIHVDDLVFERRLKLRVRSTTLIVTIDPLGTFARRVTFSRHSWLRGSNAVPPPDVLAKRYASLFGTPRGDNGYPATRSAAVVEQIGEADLPTAGIRTAHRGVGRS